MDQPGKRIYTNLIGGNSQFGGRFGHSFHCKDLQDKLQSCSKCEHLIMKRDDNDNCEDCLNWNFPNEKYSETVTNENLGI